MNFVENPYMLNKEVTSLTYISIKVNNFIFIVWQFKKKRNKQVNYAENFYLNAVAKPFEIFVKIKLKH